MAHTPLGAKVICAPRENTVSKIWSQRGRWSLTLEHQNHSAFSCISPLRSFCSHLCCIPTAGPAALTVPALSSSPLNTGTGTPSCWAPPGEHGELAAAVAAGCGAVQDRRESNSSFFKQIARFSVLGSGVGNAVQVISRIRPHQQHRFGGQIPCRESDCE